jgi:hypothetical protein
MLDAMREVEARGGVPRGIVDIEEHAPDGAFAELHALGVRGVRINVSPVQHTKPVLRRHCCRASNACTRVAPSSGGSSIS